MFRQGVFARDYALKRYETTDFILSQEETLGLRKQLTQPLGLLDGDEEYFYVVKKRTDEFPGEPALDAIRNVYLVHYIENSDKPLPDRIATAARGTVVYRDTEGKVFVFSSSIPQRPEVRLNSLSLNDQGDLTLNIRGAIVDVKPANCRFRRYAEGTFYRVAMLNGKMQGWTSHNLLPGGLVIGNERVHKPAVWGTNPESFKDSFERIALATDPNLMDPRVMFPLGAKTANHTYNFILVRSSDVRASNDYVPKGGYLVYLGATENWSYAQSGLSERTTGTPMTRADVYVPHMMSNDILGPEHPESYIMDGRLRSATLSFEDASNYLYGDHAVLNRDLSGGGKLIAELNYYRGSKKMSQVIHIESDAFNHRRQIVGTGESSLYVQFVRHLALSDFLPGDELQAVATKLFPPVLSMLLPDNPENVEAAKRAIATGSALPVIEIREDEEEMSILRTYPTTTVQWHMMLCAHPRLRGPMILYPENFQIDSANLINWCTAVVNDYEKRIVFRPTSRVNQEGGGKKADDPDRDRRVVAKYYADMMAAAPGIEEQALSVDPKFQPGQYYGARIFIRTRGDETSKAITTMRRSFRLTPKKVFEELGLQIIARRGDIDTE